MSAVTSEQGFLGNLKRWSPHILAVLVFLLPLWVLPTSYFSVPFSKVLLTGLVTFILAGGFVLGCIGSGTITLLRSPVIITAAALPLLYFLSAFLSSSWSRSLVGEALDVDSALFITSASLFLLLTALFVRTKKALFNICAGLLSSFLLLGLYQLLLIFGGAETFSFGAFSTPTFSLIGPWGDFGAFAGVIALLLLVTLEFLPASLLVRVALYICLGLSAFFLVLVNSPAVWLALSLSAGFLAIFKLSQGPKGETRSLRHMPVQLIGTVLLCVFFLFGSTLLSDPLGRALGVVAVEAHPSWQGTLVIVKETLSKNLWFGAGPNQFEYEWRKHKPPEVNITPFWNLDFKNGVGVWPTALVTVGVIGGLLWLLFFFAVLFEAYRSLQVSKEDPAGRYLSLVAAAGSIYFVLMFFVHVPSSALYLLAFMFFGLCVSASRLNGLSAERETQFARTSFLAFLSISLLLALFAAILAGLYVLTKEGLGSFFYGRATQVYSESRDVAGAESFLMQANRVNEKDANYRALSDLKLIALSNLFREARSLPEEAVRVQLQTLLREAIAYGQKAVTLDPYNHQNLLILARAYESVVPIKVNNAYENANATYLSAQALAPSDPSIELTLARLEILNGTLERASEHLDKAFALKPNYTEAVFLKSQLESLRGNVSVAINAAEAAVAISPEEPVLYFQLGLLNYHAKHYRESVVALERAVALESNYANARYFLGLSYSALKERGKAIAQFRLIRTSNPGNGEVERILLNLEAGREPFAEAVSADKKPETRSRPPIPEGSDSDRGL